MAVSPSANALTLLPDVKAFLKIAITTDDDLLQGLINACSTAIERYCRRKFKSQTYTNEFYDGTGYKTLNLKNYPVSNVSSVSIDGVVLSSSNYVCKTDTGVLARKGPSLPGLRVNSNWPEGDWNIQVTYTAGYTTIPDDLELACKMFVASIYKADIAAFSTTFNEGFVFKADAIPVQVKLMLQPYVDTSGGIN
jgi:uncharacterized phiE125 gp8 family phage protein